MVVVEGTDADQLRSGPGHYPGTPLPGEAGNVAIAGHRTTYLHPFYNLDGLAPGDPISVLTVQGLFVYHVVSIQAVDPTDVAVVAPTPTPMLTLTTCNPRYSASQRLVVQAALVAGVLTGAKGPVTTKATHPRSVPLADGAIRKDWWSAIGLGLAVVAIVIGLWVLAGRLGGSRRWAVVVAGTLGCRPASDPTQFTATVPDRHDPPRRQETATVTRDSFDQEVGSGRRGGRALPIRWYVGGG